MLAQVEVIAKQAQREAALFEHAGDEPMHLATQLVTYSEAPGYRDVGFIFDVQAIGASSTTTHRIELHVRAEDGEAIAEHIRRVHNFAWSRASGGPLDQKPGETRPRWLQSPA